MGRNGQAPGPIIAKRRGVVVSLAKGKTLAEKCRALGVCEQTFFRWRNGYGSLKVD